MAICAWYASERSTPVTSRFSHIFLRRTGWRIFTCTASMRGTPHDRPESEGAGASDGKRAPRRDVGQAAIQQLRYELYCLERPGGASATFMISAVQERFFRCHEITARTIRSRHEPAEIGDGVGNSDGVGSSDGILEHVRAHAEEKVAATAVCARLLDPRLK